MLRGKVSQSAFGKRLGVSQASIGVYERGERAPDSAFIERVCVEFGVTADWLVLGVEPGEKPPTVGGQKRQQAEIIDSRKNKAADVAGFADSAADPDRRRLSRGEMERVVRELHEETDREARAVLRKIAPDEDELVEKLSGRALTMILTKQLDEWTTLHKEHSDLLRENGDLRVEAERMRARISELERQLAEAGGAAPR